MFRNCYTCLEHGCRTFPVWHDGAPRLIGLLIGIDQPRRTSTLLLLPLPLSLFYKKLLYSCKLIPTSSAHTSTKEQKNHPCTFLYTFYRGLYFCEILCISVVLCSPNVIWQKCVFLIYFNFFIRITLLCRQIR